VQGSDSQRQLGGSPLSSLSALFPPTFFFFPSINFAVDFFFLSSFEGVLSSAFSGQSSSPCPALSPLDFDKTP